MSLSNGRHLAFPFRIGADGRSVAPVDDAAHVRDELMQLLLTSPGERLFLPDFGGGLRRLVFEPASDALRAVVKARITNALSRWLKQRLTVEMIDVTWNEAAALMEVTVQYRLAGSNESRVAKFQRAGQ